MNCSLLLYYFNFYSRSWFSIAIIKCGLAWSMWISKPPLIALYIYVLLYVRICTWPNFARWLSLTRWCIVPSDSNKSRLEIMHTNKCDLFQSEHFSYGQYWFTLYLFFTCIKRVIQFTFVWEILKYNTIYKCICVH